MRKLLWLLCLLPLLSAMLPYSAVTLTSDSMPYEQAGLTKRQAAAHLLDRFSFGARPEDVDYVAGMGPEAWFEAQLAANRPEPAVAARIGNFKTLDMSTREIAQIYPPPGKVIIELMREGKLSNLDDLKDSNNKEYRKAALKYAYENGYRPQLELLGEMVATKIIRAVYAENQLKEVMTDFWFNHFTVSAVKGPARNFIPTYERDAIRPHVFGTFHEILQATAKHPAMLQYLDNVQSTAPEGTPTLLSTKMDSMKSLGGLRGWFARRKIEKGEAQAEQMKQAMYKGLPEEFKPKRGINENYARELMELHTLGVDGGYTQKDVTEVARALTGWSMLPLGLNKNGEKIMSMIEKTKEAGTVVEGDFLFRADAHDVTPKVILGKQYAAGRGLDEGEEILRTLSEHPSTAKRIALKICVRFVSDNPPPNLVEKVTETFSKTHGDICEMLRTIVRSPEFWSAESLRSKIKSPFELAVSSMRALRAEVHPTKKLYDWITRLGQQMYAAQAPTGFADKAEAWVNSGSLLNRMNFGLALASNEIKGVHVNLPELNRNAEPESLEAALRTYFALLMPERDAEESLRLLLPVINDPDFGKKVNAASSKNSSQADLMNDEDVINEDELESLLSADNAPKAAALEKEKYQAGALRNVVGILLGSPEFQRR